MIGAILADTQPTEARLSKERNVLSLLVKAFQIQPWASEGLCQIYPPATAELICREVMQDATHPP